MGNVKGAVRPRFTGICPFFYAVLTFSFFVRLAFSGIESRCILIWGLHAPRGFERFAIRAGAGSALRSHGVFAFLVGVWLIRAGVGHVGRSKANEPPRVSPVVAYLNVRVIRATCGTLHQANPVRAVGIGRNVVVAISTRNNRIMVTGWQERPPGGGVFRMERRNVGRVVQGRLAPRPVPLPANRCPWGKPRK